MTTSELWAPLNYAHFWIMATSEIGPPLNLRTPGLRTSLNYDDFWIMTTPQSDWSHWSSALLPCAVVRPANRFVNSNIYFFLTRCYLRLKTSAGSVIMYLCCILSSAKSNACVCQDSVWLCVSSMNHCRLLDWRATAGLVILQGKGGVRPPRAWLPSRLDPGVKKQVLIATRSFLVQLSVHRCRC